MLPPIAVVIATRNRPHFLAQCLASVVEQSYPPAAVVVVDDGSDTDLGSVREQFTGSLPLRWIRYSGGGVCAARNLATLAIQEPWACIMDDDDVMFPGRILAHARHVSEGRVDISYGGWVNFEEGRYAGFYPGKVFDAATLIFEGGVLTHGASLINTDLLRDHPYNEKLLGGGDFELFARLAQAKAKFGHCGEYVLYRRLHDKRIGADETLRATQRETRRRTVERLQAEWRDLNLPDRRESATQRDIAAPDISSIAEVCRIEPPLVLDLTINRSLAGSEGLLLAVVQAGLEGHLMSDRANSARVSLQLPFASWSDPALKRLLDLAASEGMKSVLRDSEAGTPINRVRLPGEDGKMIEHEFGDVRQLLDLAGPEPVAPELRLVG